MTTTARVATTLRPQLTGNAGLYYVCYRLSLLGWNAMPTARNARGVDVMAYTQDARAKVAIQVKALSKRRPVPLGSDLGGVMGDWWVIVTGVAAKEPVAFVMRASEVRRRAQRHERDGRVSFWLQPPRYDIPRYREAWPRIGRGDDAV